MVNLILIPGAAWNDGAGAWYAGAGAEAIGNDCCSSVFSDFLD